MQKIFLILIVIIAFLLRFINYSFPTFTSEEARIAYRGYVLATQGKDELGRSYPVLFNSLEDYQLPITSYLTGVGIFLFGKSDLGARLPFIIIGTIIVLLGYKIAQVFTSDRRIWLISALTIAFSPALIFLSRTPNETIVLVALLLLLFYLLTQEVKRTALITSVMLFAIFVSKNSWFILTPLVFFTLYFFKDKYHPRRVLLLVSLSVVLSVFVFVFFLTGVDQAKRSLIENNFSIFSDVTLMNGINKLRGQGIESGWPPLIEKMMFNKAHFIVIGLLHWLSNVQLSVYFARFDETGITTFSNMGAFSKVLIIPFLLGIINVIRNGGHAQRVLLFFPLVLTFPTMLIYPKMSPNIVALTLPFLALIISLGFTKMGTKVASIIIFIMALELIFNIFYTSPYIKRTNTLRPAWIWSVTNDISNVSASKKVAVSDDIVKDIAPFVQWSSPSLPNNELSQLNFPYKFSQWKLPGVMIIASDAKLYSCKNPSVEKAFISNGDLTKLRNSDSSYQISKSYKDSLDDEKASLLLDPLCIN